MPVKKIANFTLFVLFIHTVSLFPAAGTLGYDGACPPLAPPTGATVTVDSEQALVNAVNSAAPGSTILIADGTYNLGPKGLYLWIDTPGVTLRSAGGDRDGVVLNDNYGGTETITVAASDVTIADITLMRAGTHAIHVVSTDNGATLNARIYNVHIIDPGQQGIKINPHAARTHFTDNGVVACSVIELTDAGRTKVWEINGSCYTGGVDGHQSRGWVVRDNTIKGFWCRQGLSEHGVHFWTGSRDTLVERNMFIDNARGVGFGLVESGSGRLYSDNPCPGANGYVDHYGGIIRNNFIFASRSELFASASGVDGGISLAQACGARVLHNTVAFTSAPFAAIEWRFSNTDADLTNNLVTHNLMDRGGSANLSGNLTQQPLSLFIDGAHGDLHLDTGADAALDKGVGVPAGLCEDDFDGETRPTGAAGDIGADERHDGPVNTAPIATEQSLTVMENSVDNPVTLTGFDAENDPLTFRVATQPHNGSLSGAAPYLLYTPDARFSGDDNFSFVVNDSALDSISAWVSITVRAASVTSGGGGGGCFIDISKFLP